jgi:hypothetical protein
MTSTFSGGQSYVQSTDVVEYLHIADIATPADLTYLDTTVIPFVSEYIDRLSGSTWGLKSTATDNYHNEYNGYEMKSIGQYTAYGLYLIGAPIYLSHYPIVPVVMGSFTNNANPPQSIQSMLIWNGNFYQEWEGIYQEGRYSQYWTDRTAGIMYIMGWYWWMGYEAMVKYQYGYNQMQYVAAGTGILDPYVYELAVMKSAHWFLSSERYTATVSQGIGGIEIPAQWSFLNQRIRELEIYIKGYKRIAGTWMS